MRYQITCDNCGTQFIIDAEPGQTIECQCPGCHGVMQVTLPNAAKGEHYQAPQPDAAQPAGPWQAETVDTDTHPNRRWLWVGIAVVVVVMVAIGFAMLNTSSSQPEPTTPVVADTIPYDEPTVEDERPQQQVDTIVELPEEPETEQEEPQEETAPQNEPVDTMVAE